uniref:Uncharacterized protein n=1 Tax=Cacopsylla melanoneura TaxID=428564 RepID=A0A8D8X0S0_9HEMI
MRRIIIRQRNQGEEETHNSHEPNTSYQPSTLPSYPHTNHHYQTLTSPSYPTPINHHCQSTTSTYLQSKPCINMPKFSETFLQRDFECITNGFPSITSTNYLQLPTTNMDSCINSMCLNYKCMPSTKHVQRPSNCMIDSMDYKCKSSIKNNEKNPRDVNYKWNAPDFKQRHGKLNNVLPSNKHTQRKQTTSSRIHPEYTGCTTSYGTNRERLTSGNVQPNHRVSKNSRHKHFQSSNGRFKSVNKRLESKYKRCPPSISDRIGPKHNTFHRPGGCCNR